METKKALVLTGGSIKGCFQVGAIKAIFEKGYKFDSIYGISVGSLNGSFILNEIGKQNVSSIDSIDWLAIGNNLMKFWLDNIIDPGKIIKKKRSIKLLGSIMTNDFKGLVDTGPLHTLVRNTLKMDYLLRSPIKLTIGAVNISDGDLYNVEPTVPNFIDYVLASTAIPIMMPYLNIGGSATQCFFDGGIRNIAPLKQAIRSGAEEIVCVSCHPDKISSSGADFKHLMNLANRVFEIIENEIISKDIEWAEYCNAFLPEDGSVETDGPLAGYRRFKLTVVRPAQQINLDLENFRAEDIKAIIDSGYQTAKEILAS